MRRAYGRPSPINTSVGIENDEGPNPACVWAIARVPLANRGRPFIWRANALQEAVGGQVFSREWVGGLSPVSLQHQAPSGAVVGGK